MTKICPVCGKENDDNAQFCVNCNYDFSSNPQDSPPSSDSSTSSNSSKFPKKIIGIATIIVIVIAAIIFLPSFFHHSTYTEASAAGEAYGGKWIVNTTYSGTEVINSNNTATIKFLNGTSTVVPVNSTGLAGTRALIMVLTQKNTTNYIEVSDINFTNTSIASKYFSSFYSSIEQESSFTNMSVNNASYQNYKIVYIAGGSIKTIYGVYPVPSIAMAIYGSNVITLRINGFSSNLSQIDDLLKPLI